MPCVVKVIFFELSIKFLKLCRDALDERRAEVRNGPQGLLILLQIFQRGHCGGLLQRDLLRQLCLFHPRSDPFSHSAHQPIEARRGKQGEDQQKRHQDKEAMEVLEVELEIMGGFFCGDAAICIDYCRRRCRCGFAFQLATPLPAGGLQVCRLCLS